MSVDVPDIRQRAEHDCGIACVRAVLSACGQAVYSHSVAWALGTTQDGTEKARIAGYFAERGLCVVAGNMTTEDLRHHIRSGRPVICLTLMHGTGHYVVVTDVRRGRVHYHDPAAGPDSLPVAEWEHWWGRFSNWGCATWNLTSG